MMDVKKQEQTSCIRNDSEWGGVLEVEEDDNKTSRIEKNSPLNPQLVRVIEWNKTPQSISCRWLYI
jgi:hypothetical protein